MQFTPLNLPPAELRLIRSEGKIKVSCLIRKKAVLLTPEEWVRQHVLNYLMLHAGYQKGKIAVEYALKYNRTIKRCDILVFNDLGAPLMIVECKAPEVSLNKDTFYQAAKYDHTLNSSCLLVSNGLIHYSIVKSRDDQNLSLKEGIVSKEELSHF